MEQKVLVCGGRDYSDRETLFSVLDIAHAANPIIEIMHGCAAGADALANDWACARSVRVRKFPADWDTHGKAAGPIRNREMLDRGKPHMVIAFPGGAGTRNMVEQSAGANVPTIAVSRDAAMKRLS